MPAVVVLYLLGVLATASYLGLAGLHLPLRGSKVVSDGLCAIGWPFFWFAVAWSHVYGRRLPPKVSPSGE